MYEIQCWSYLSRPPFTTLDIPAQGMYQQKPRSSGAAHPVLCLSTISRCSFPEGFASFHSYSLKKTYMWWKPLLHLLDDIKKSNSTLYLMSLHIKTTVTFFLLELTQPLRLLQLQQGAWQASTSTLLGISQHIQVIVVPEDNKENL